MSARKWLLGVRPAWVRTGKGWDAAEALLAPRWRAAGQGNQSSETNSSQTNGKAARHS